MGETRQNRESEKAGDITVAMFLCNHIDNPCEVEVAGKVENIRDFWIKEAKRFVETCEDSYAKGLVEAKIKEYEVKK